MDSSVIIVGSGVGGAVLADELSQKDIAVTVIESGKFQKLGTEMRALNFYSGTTFCPAEKSI